MAELMTIIDAHTHLWLRQDTEVNGLKIQTLKNGRSIFLGEEVQMLPPWLIDGQNSAEVLLSNMDYAQVGGAVVVQEFIDGIQNEYLATVSRRYGDRIKVFAMADFRLPGFLPDVKNLLATGDFIGVAIPAHRLPAGKDDRVMLTGPEFMAMYRLLEEQDRILSITPADGDFHVAELEEVISEFPKLKIAIGHFGMPTHDGWLSQIRLARHENVMIESGGITWLYNSEFYPFKGAIRAIREAIDEVGVEKLMWGSDYPRTITAITYRMSYDFVTKSDALTDAEKRAFLGENAHAFYGFGPLPELPYIKNMSE